MKIEAANLCAECGEIVESDVRICPKCLSSQFLGLEGLLDERHRKWLKGITEVRARAKGI